MPAKKLFNTNIASERLTTSQEWAQIKVYDNITKWFDLLQNAAEFSKETYLCSLDSKCSKNKIYIKRILKISNKIGGVIPWTKGTSNWFEIQSFVYVIIHKSNGLHDINYELA